MTAGILDDTTPVTRALTVTREGAAELITALRDGGLDHHDVGGKAEILDLFQELFVMMQAIDAEMIARCRDGKVAEQECQRSMVNVLERRCLVGPGEAKRRVRAAEAIGSRVTPTGLPLPPVRSRIAEAMAEGLINADQVRAVCATLDKLDRARVDARRVEAIEAELVQYSRRFGPKELERLGQRYLDVHDPDGSEPDEQRNHDRRFFHLNPTASGAYRVEGRLTGELGAKIAAVLSPLAKPRIDKITGDDGQISPAATADLRSHEQRMHDALDDAFSRLLRAGKLPDSGGTPASVIITIDSTDLLAHTGRLPDTFAAGSWVCPDCGATGQPTAGGEDRVGSAETTPTSEANDRPAQDATNPPVPDPTHHDDQGLEGEELRLTTRDSCALSLSKGQASCDLPLRQARGTLIISPDDPPGRVRRRQPGRGTTSLGATLTIPELLRLANEADIYPVVMTQHGVLLDMGYSRRIATKQQTMALIARDGGCSFPACDFPAEWCQRHHVLSWAENGKTSVENLTLLCSWHHHQFLLRGWTVRMNQDGLPEWIPPRWIGPDQKPMINNRIIARIHQSTLVDE